MSKLNFLLDLGGSFFGELASPCFSDDFNSNSFLYSVQRDYLRYIEARLAFICLLKQIGGSLEKTPWYADVDYNLFWNNIETGLFIGNKTQRYASFQNYPMDFVIRLDVYGAKEDKILIGIAEEHIDVAVGFAEQFQLWEKAGLKVPSISIVTPQPMGETLEEQHLYKDWKPLHLDKMMGMVVFFCVQDGGELQKLLMKGSENIVVWLSEVFDAVARSNDAV